jgi:hypothetical protein
MKEYTKPQLTLIGKLENLTTGGSGRSRESVNRKRSKDDKKSRP